MSARHRFARRVFLGAAIYGILVLVPQYFMEELIGRDYPPRISHPEHFYGFVGVALAWQFAFLVIARDVKKYRLFMIPAVLEKLAFGLAAIVLYFQGRLHLSVLAAGMFDLVLATLFIVAFRLTRNSDGEPARVDR